MHSYEINKHGKIVFPSNCFPDLDFSTLESLEQLEAVVRRDFDSKAPTGTDILEQINAGGYRSKFALMRDMALNLFWANRFKITMYDVRPTRWADVPRSRDDVFVPILTPWQDSETKVSAVLSAYPDLPAQWDAEVEDSIFEVLFDVFGHRRNHATKLSAVIPTVADLLSNPGNQTLRLNRYDPDFRRYSYDEIINCNEDVPELEALRRWSMVLHNQYPWARSEAALVAVEKLRENDYVAVFYPRNAEVQHFLSRVTSGPAPKTAHPVAPTAVAPVRPYPAIDVRNDLAVRPRILAISAAHGDQVCTNEDIIRNSAYNWSPMSAEDISGKTGIEQRRYTSDSLEDLSLRAARSALAHAQVGPEQIGAVIVCTCTSSRLMPSVATWLSGALGIQQTLCSFDLVAACAGFSYGLAEATRILQQA
jgi:3-oxoacyl-[acyl-carrier-protein] synthase III